MDAKTKRNETRHWLSGGNPGTFMRLGSFADWYLVLAAVPPNNKSPRHTAYAQRRNFEGCSERRSMKRSPRGDGTTTSEHQRIAAAALLNTSLDCEIVCPATFQFLFWTSFAVTTSYII